MRDAHACHVGQSPINSCVLNSCRASSVRQAMAKERTLGSAKLHACALTAEADLPQTHLGCPPFWVHTPTGCHVVVVLLEML
jgi:hypothetical protein